MLLEKKMVHKTNGSFVISSLSRNALYGKKKKNIGKKMFFITDMDGSAIIHLATLIQRFKSYWAYYQHCFSYRLRIHSQWHNPD